MTKQELRKEYLKKRLTLSDSEYEHHNQQLAIKFFNHIDLTSVKKLHVFLPLVKNKEPNTWLLIHAIQNDFPAIEIIVPKAKLLGEMDHYVFKNEDQLVLNSWGIPEPVTGNLVSPVEIDLVIVPLLAFDQQFQRVGYGKGFYDRFLSQCRSDCKKIGLSFFEPVDKINDVDEYDFPLDDVIIG